MGPEPTSRIWHQSGAAGHRRADYHPESRATAPGTSNVLRRFLLRWLPRCHPRASTCAVRPRAPSANRTHNPRPPRASASGGRACRLAAAHARRSRSHPARSAPPGPDRRAPSAAPSIGVRGPAVVRCGADLAKVRDRTGDWERGRNTRLRAMAHQGLAATSRLPAPPTGRPARLTQLGAETPGGPPGKASVSVSGECCDARPDGGRGPRPVRVRQGRAHRPGAGATISPAAGRPRSSSAAIDRRSAAPCKTSERTL